MRTVNVLVSREITPVGSSDSAAATVTISAPQSEKTTVVAPASTATQPNGAKPPRLSRFENAAPSALVRPNTCVPAIAMNATMAPTLIEANQNSNSPYERDDIRFTAVSSSINASTICHTGNAIQ